MINIIRIILIFIIALGLLGGGAYWVIQSLAGTDEDQISKIAEELEQQANTEVEAETVKADETGEQEQPDLGMTETQLQTYMHQMTHQKITAGKKRGAVEMSEKNIKNLLKIVQVNHGAYEHSDFYEKSLTAWGNGDFSNSVSVHNTIWEWHDGTVGRAMGLMSTEQEAAYVKKHFE